MLSLELARTIHEDRQREIEARSRVTDLLRRTESRLVAVGRPPFRSRQPDRHASLTTSDGRG